MNKSGLGLASDEMVVRGLPASKGSCAIHLYHSPRPQELHFHHILPLAWGGKDEPYNRILICPTSHASIHMLLREYQKLGGRPDWKVLRQYSEAERELAERAWSQS